MNHKFKIGVLLVGFGFSLTACNDFFDIIPMDNIITLDMTFTDRTKTDQFLTNVYSFVPDEHGQRDGCNNGTAGIWTGASSEAKFSWDFVRSNAWTMGTVDPSTDWVSKLWDQYYMGIARAGIFINNVDRCTSMDASVRKTRKAEARALRAYYYYQLLRVYGPVVLLGDNVLNADTPLSDMIKARNSVDECVDFITSEFDLAAEDLSVNNYGTAEAGRMNQGICKALKAQCLLLAASPLYNGNTDYANMKNADGKQLISQTYDATKWETARKAYKEFFDKYGDQYELVKAYTSDGKLDPWLSLRNLQVTQSLNKEMILYREVDNNGFYYELTPYHSDAPDATYKGGGGKAATQELVDLYFTDKGLPIDQDPSYNQYTGVPKMANLQTTDYKDPHNSARTLVVGANAVLKQWAHREPRFYTDITFNGDVWVRTAKAVTTWTYYNGNSGLKVAAIDCSKTGYVARKSMPDGSWKDGKHAVMLLRLAEMYLSYAEVLNECGYRDDAIAYVNMVRVRAGVPSYGNDGSVDESGNTVIPYSDTYEDVRNRIRRERAVELSFESVRYFDVHRWKVADMTVGDGWVYPTYHEGGEGGAMYGLNVAKDIPLNFYEKKSFENRVFDKKSYFFPIPQAEVRRNNLMIQNTGWTVEDTK